MFGKQKRISILKITKFKVKPKIQFQKKMSISSNFRF